MGKPGQKGGKRRLSTEARKLFKRVVAEWNIQDEAGRFLLTVACEALTEMREAQETLAREGAIIRDRFGQDRLHPACQREKEARAHMLAAFKQLNLDLASLER